MVEQIDVRLLDKCPVLTDYEKELIIRVDVKGETQASIAKSYGKSPATICIQHKKALEKFNAWRQSYRNHRKTEEDFDKQAFEMFNKVKPPNKVIERLGKADRVVKLWKQYRSLMEDDYCTALNKITEYGRKPREDSRFSLSEQIDYLTGENYVFSEEKREIWTLLEERCFTQGLDPDAYGSICDAFKSLLEDLRQKEALERKVKEVENQLDAVSRELIEARAEIMRLERLRKYENLSDEQIQKRKEKVRKLEYNIGDLEYQLSNLNQQVDKQKEIVFNLNAKIRETMMEFLAKMDINDIWRLIVEAKWGRRSNWLFENSRRSAAFINL